MFPAKNHILYCSTHQNAIVLQMYEVGLLSPNQMTSWFISENLTRGTNGTYEKSWGGEGNMKTHVAVYEEGLSD